MEDPPKANILTALDDNAELYKMWRIRRTVLQLCHDRGYLIVQNELDETFDLFKAKYNGQPTREELTLLCAHNNNMDDKIYVFFPEDPKIGVKVVQQYAVRMEEDQVHRAIVIVRAGLTPSAKQAMKNIGPEYVMEDFLESEMLINITEHELVPQHILLTVEEKEELFSRYKLKESQLMKMLTTDPVARYYGFKRGQVVKIVRNSDTAGRYVTHRLVV